MTQTSASRFVLVGVSGFTPAMTAVGGLHGTVVVGLIVLAMVRFVLFLKVLQCLVYIPLGIRDLSTL